MDVCKSIEREPNPAHKQRQLFTATCCVIYLYKFYSFTLKTHAHNSKLDFKLLSYKIT